MPNLPYSTHVLKCLNIQKSVLVPTLNCRKYSSLTDAAFHTSRIDEKTDEQKNVQQRGKKATQYTKQQKVHIVWLPSVQERIRCDLWLAISIEMSSRIEYIGAYL